MESRSFTWVLSRVSTWPWQVRVAGEVSPMPSCRNIRHKPSSRLCGQILPQPPGGCGGRLECVLASVAGSDTSRLRGKCMPTATPRIESWLLQTRSGCCSLTPVLAVRTSSARGSFANDSPHAPIAKLHPLILGRTVRRKNECRRLPPPLFARLRSFFFFPARGHYANRK